MVSTRSKAKLGSVVCSSTKQSEPSGAKKFLGTTFDTGEISVPNYKKNNSKYNLKSCSVLIENINNVIPKSSNSQIKTLPCKIVLNDIMRKNVTSELDKLISKCGDGKTCRIFKCRSKRNCELKKNFVARDSCVSSCTFRSYPCITPPGTKYVDCHASNVVYLITCQNCGLQYVGETAQTLAERFGKYRYDLRFPEKSGGKCRIFVNHFTKGHCKGSGYSVQIIEKLEGNGRTPRGAIDPSFTSKRRAREVHWMLQLRTVFPYGLNDRIDEYQLGRRDCIGKKFPSLKRNFERSSRGRFHNSPHGPNHESFLNQFDLKLETSLKDALNFARLSLSSMKSSELKKLATVITDRFSNQQREFPFSQWYSVCLDMIDSRIMKDKPVKKKKVAPDNPCHILFDNKAIDIINLARILKSSKVTQTIPSCVKNFQKPTIIFNLKEPVGSKIFNFNKFSSSFDVKSFVKDPNTLPCSCANSSFKDPHHKHIVTGDLRIVENEKLRKLLSRGPKYRESKQLDFVSARKEIVLGIENCIKNYCDKYRMNISVLNGWRVEVLKAVDDRILEISSKLKVDYVEETLKDSECRQYLSDLHSRYVIAPIDKATGNVSLICKRFYAEVLIKELGIAGVDSETYELTRKKYSTVIKKNKVDLKNKFNIDVSEVNETLPNIYWLPKLHKNPLKFRFIIAAPKCSLKPLSKAVTSVFRLFFNQTQRYHRKCSIYSSVKTFWVIQDNKEVLDSLEKLNKRGKAQCMTTFDFSTLYTKIPHDKLISVLNEITDTCFKGGDRELISVTNSGARWVTKPSAIGITFTKASFKDAIKYLMSNCFFTLGDVLFRQVIGIPMGSDPAPFMANLFLYYYESKYVKEVKKKDLFTARKFRNTFRFIDDLLAINDDGEFQRSFKDIYPPELELKKEHGGDSVSFLDIKISISGRSFETSLFDKRDSFPFSIVRMPYKCSNMPSKIFYSTIGAEILRIGRISSSSELFVSSAKPLVQRMLRQGANFKMISRTLKRIYGRHQELKKLAINATEFVRLLQ